MIRIQHSAVAHVPAELAFEYMSDHANVPKWMFGVSRFDPVGEQVRGIDATFDATMKLGPKALKSVLRVSDWEENKLITLESISGVQNTSSWRFEEVGEGETRLDVTFTYSFPSGFAGKALERVVEPFVGEAIRHTDAAVRRQLEALHDGAGSAK